MLHPPKAPSGLRVRQSLGEETGRPLQGRPHGKPFHFFPYNKDPAAHRAVALFISRAENPHGRCSLTCCNMHEPGIVADAYGTERHQRGNASDRNRGHAMCAYLHGRGRISAQRRPRPDFRKSALRRPEGRTPCRQARQRPRKATFLPPCHAQRLIRGAIQQTFYCSKSTPHNPMPKARSDGPNSVGNTISSPVSRGSFLTKYRVKARFCCTS